MSLKRKILLVIILTFCGLFAIQYVLSETILLRSFRTLEEMEVRKQTARVVNTFENSIQSIGVLTQDWATWDDAYRFVQGGNADFESVNIVASTFTTLRLNAILFTDPAGRLVLGRGYDLEEEREAPLPDGLLNHLSDGGPLQCASGTGRKTDGILSLPAGIFLVSARPVLTSDGNGPPAGTLIFGRLLDGDEVERIASLAQLPVRIERILDARRPAAFDGAGADPSGDSSILVNRKDSRSVEGRALLRDIYGNPALILQVDLPRQLYLQGEKSTFYFILFLLLATVIFAFAIMAFLHRQVLSRLGSLGNTVNLIADTSDLKARVPVTGKDELSVLAARINRMLGELELVEERKQKMEESLRQSQKMEAIGCLAGGIAHDFNNLLMGIQGHATLARMNLDPSESAREDMEAIESLVSSGAGLTRQLLGYSRGGRYEVKPLKLNDLAHQTAVLFGRTRKEIVIHEQHEAGSWTIKADRGQMEQVLMNLFVNAWQAMPGGGPLYLGTRNVFLDREHAATYLVRPGRYVKLSMTDAGVGMDEKTRQRVFEPFFTTREMGRGTGLGLATVYGIVKGHNGAITVYSEKGRGTTFNIYLPASDKLSEEEVKPPADVDGEGETILVVDDEPAVLHVTETILERLGYRVRSAQSGPEALRIYEASEYGIDLVVLDMIMPGMGGGETFERLKEMNPKVKVLLASGYSLNGEAEQIFKKGCRGFLQKPFTKGELSRKIRQILEDKPEGGDAPPA
ncbi:MAG TPA: CHASE4 domain-containing protein [Syntrophales bacterium]|nr:CHASE4 domain-containing protein [Syntrophales bacterium]HQQ28440.1 CHASE4 domain-containing protein [Syntrophales bacterium]